MVSLFESLYKRVQTRHPQARNPQGVPGTAVSGYTVCHLFGAGNNCKTKLMGQLYVFQNSLYIDIGCVLYLT
jgi:hypothetical protein